MSNDAGGKKPSAAAVQRLQRELMDMMQSGTPEGVSAFPSDDNLFVWDGTINGSPATPYEGLEYKIRLTIADDYPFSPPIVHFKTMCFHPNIELETGRVCLDILREQWSAVMSVSSVLVSLQSLLGSPNNQSPLNAQAAQLWAKPEDFRARVVAVFHESSESR